MLSQPPERHSCGCCRALSHPKFSWLCYDCWRLVEGVDGSHIQDGLILVLDLYGHHLPWVQVVRVKSRELQLLRHLLRKALQIEG
jgi:hypothetical protein